HLPARRAARHADDPGSRPRGHHRQPEPRRPASRGPLGRGGRRGASLADPRRPPPEGGDPRAARGRGTGARQLTLPRRGTARYLVIEAYPARVLGRNPARHWRVQGSPHEPVPRILMRHVLLTAGLIVCPALTSAQQRPAPAALTLADAIAIAREHNPAYRQALNNAGPAAWAARNAF